MPRAELTPKQRLFIVEYLKSLNATQAAIRAGYSKRTSAKIGTENLQKPAIRTCIDTELKRIEDAKIADVKEVMELLTSAARGDMDEEIVAFDTQGQAQVLKKKIPGRDRVKSLELLGKRYAMFTENIVTREELPKIVDDV